MSNTEARTVPMVGTTTETVTEPTPQTSIEDNQLPDAAIIRLQKKKKKVAWKQDIVDNEGLGKKSSKCCCIYRKPHEFGESSSDSEADDCDHCRGHVEKRANINAR